MNKIVIDTNVFMNEPSLLGEFLVDNKVIIPMVVLEEMDNLNHKDNQTKAYYARRGIKAINKYLEHDNIIFDNTEDVNKKNDNVILDVAEKYCAMILTFDLAMKMKAKFRDIKVASIDEKDRLKESEYKGYQIWELDLTDERDEFLLAQLYSGKFELEEDGFVENEYLVIKDSKKSEYITSFKFTNGEFKEVIRADFVSDFFGKVKSRDQIQTIAMDNLRSNKIKIVKGKAGSGKTFLSLAYCMEQIKKGKRDKIIFFVNPAGAKNSVELGFYPGSRIEKLLDTSVGTMLGAKFGEKQGLLQLMNDGVVEILPFVDIRGFDSSGQNAIIYILEAQNLDIELMKLGLQRVGDDCEVIVDGDADTQVDKEAYANGNNGMKRMAEIFRGSTIYGEVELKTIYRSDIAKLADMM